MEGSGPDLSRLYEHARWDQAARRWVRRRAVLFSRAVRGGRATLEELTMQAKRYCAELGYEVVGEHVGARGWREAVADVADGKADLLVVPSVERLGVGKQMFERLRRLQLVAVAPAGERASGPKRGSEDRDEASLSNPPVLPLLKCPKYCQPDQRTEQDHGYEPCWRLPCRSEEDDSDHGETQKIEHSCAPGTPLTKPLPVHLLHDGEHLLSVVTRYFVPVSSRCDSPAPRGGTGGAGSPVDELLVVGMIGAKGDDLGFPAGEWSRHGSSLRAECKNSGCHQDAPKFGGRTAR
ncbi:hypothetical protein AB0E12_25405 [Micromonospora chersina]|uniref:hypothetical protein n=1 Tax=Micromonospora chersina TaxID=47854 RepID=UPI0033C0BF83